MYESYDLADILKPGYHIVCELTQEQREALEYEIHSKFPDFKTVLDKKFYTKKIGPIKIRNEKTVEEFLLSDRRVKDMGVPHVHNRLKELEIYNIKDRKIFRLTMPQRELIQLIIDVENGREHYLFNEKILQEQNIRMLDWLLFGTEFIYDSVVIILTEDSLENCIDMTAKSKYFGDGWNMYKLENGKLVAHIHDKEKTIAKRKASVSSVKPSASINTAKNYSTEPTSVKAAAEKANITNKASDSQRTKIADQKEPKAKVEVIQAVRHGDLIIAICSLMEGKVSVEDKMVSERTGITYNISGAFMINSGKNPEDFVRSIEAQYMIFRVLLRSNSKEIPEDYDMLIIY